MLLNLTINRPELFMDEIMSALPAVDGQAGCGRRDDVRRHCHRRRDLRHLSALPAAAARHEGAGLRSRHQSRRHVVLVPLPRRALRFRKLELRLFLLGGAAEGMGLEGAFLAPAGQPGIPEPGRRQVRSAPGHAVPLARDRRALERRGEPVDRDPGKRGDGKRALPVHRDRHPVGAHAAAHSGRGEFPRPRLAHGALAAHAGGFHRQACRHHRHRRNRDPGDPRDREAGEASHRLPAQAELGRAAAQCKDRQGGDGGDQEPLRGDLRPLRRRRRAGSSTSPTRARRWRCRRRNARRSGKSVMPSRASASGWPISPTS